MSGNSPHGPLVARNPAQALVIATRVARQRGFTSRPLLAPSLTNTVLSLPDDGVMIRIAPPGITLHRVQTEVDVCRKLLRLLVPIVQPLADRAVTVDRESGAVVSLWVTAPQRRIATASFRAIWFPAISCLALTVPSSAIPTTWPSVDQRGTWASCASTWTPWAPVIRMLRGISQVASSGDMERRCLRGRMPRESMRPMTLPGRSGPSCIEG